MFFQNKKLFLAAVMIAAALVGLPSKTFAQGQSVTIKLSDAPLSQLIRQAEQQTDYRFVYESHAIDISSRISVDVKNASIQTLLDKALSGTPITYTVTGNKILLSPRDSQSKWPRMIRGTVRDAADVPVPGVAVMPEGTRSGVSTDLEGRYTIQLDRPASLLFSCLGYADKRAQVNPRSDILDVTLEEAMTALDEVVVIGYGQARKADLTGSTTSVSGEKLASKVTPNLSHALQGTMSGVQVTRSTGDPSSGSTIRVRGVTTMSTNDPLIIIDGVSGSLDTVAPEDVKDIQVLKDAASAAIYGSRAAAGVILVPTKRAKVDEFKLSYNFEYGIDRPTEVRSSPASSLG